MVKKLWRYVKPFSSDTGTSRTDGHTDLLYQYRASVCWRAIKTGGQNLYRPDGRNTEWQEDRLWLACNYRLICERSKRHDLSAPSPLPSPPQRLLLAGPDATLSFHQHANCVCRRIPLLRQRQPNTQRNIYRVFQKVAPKKLFWNIFTSVKSFCGNSAHLLVSQNESYSRISIIFV